MDVLYLVKESEDNEELRYSLRSLRNLPHDKVFIAGYKPSWVTNVIYIPVKQSHSKQKSATLNWLTANKHPELSDDYILFNDDFFINAPIPSLKPFYRVDDYITPQLKRTYALLKKIGIPNPKNYELHIPMVFNKAKRSKMTEIQKMYNRPLMPICARTFYGNLYKIGGTPIIDPKNTWSTGSTFLSSSDKNFELGLGTYLRARFPDPSPYEVS